MNNNTGCRIHFRKKVCDSPFMRRFIGFMLFFIAIGMLFMLLIESKVVGIILIGLFLLVGYNFHCKWW
jgi:hypothetical protein